MTMKSRICQIVTLVSLGMTVTAGCASITRAAEAPIKEVLKSRLGWDVNRTKAESGAPQNERNFCTTESGDICVAGRQSEAAGGFAAAEGVAVQADPSAAQYGDIYVADKANGRVQVFTPEGVFVMMFGWDVNKKGGNICTQAEESECVAGQPVTGGPAGQIAKPSSVTVDPATGDLYVLDVSNERVEKYSATGAFLLMIGQGVNKKGGNLCTATEESECQAAQENKPPSVEGGAFKPEKSQGNLLAVGPNGDLYVGDEGRVQKFDEDGHFIRNFPLSGTVTSLAVDGAGQLYLVIGVFSSIIHKLNSSGEEVTEGKWPVTLSPAESGADVFRLPALAMDPLGRLAATEFEQTIDSQRLTRGAMLDSSGNVMTLFELPFGSSGLGFSPVEINGGFAMFAGSLAQEVFAYQGVPVGEASTAQSSCVSGVDKESDATFDCTIEGELDPWGVKETEAWFEWGKSLFALNERTRLQQIVNEKSKEDEEEAKAKISADLGGLRPNTTYFYRLAGYDQNVKPPESAFTGAVDSFKTEIVAPRVVGEPNSFFVAPTSVTLFAEVNAENTSTEYFFEYGEHLSGYCEGPSRSKTLTSSVYGPIGTMLEVTGLRADSSYQYRLCAVNELHQKATGAKLGTFMTPAPPLPQASTGPAVDVGSSSATISGSIVAGEPVAYQFELGVYAGAATQYGIVSSGSVEGGGSPTEVTLSLAGLQPATSYGYRIKVTNGSGVSYGATGSFTTLPVLSIPIVGPIVIVPYPSFAFPSEPRCRHGYRRDRHGKCVKLKTKRKRVRNRPTRRDKAGKRT